ncbi:unnamed protein product [Owenia fusiformis]|uniref:Uncharacterized protein n=1 Tax=Owenia fusiformis TaxID=6347 RepID=A0A8S4PIT8_OWEFU|nr:unnamed protein product [Owenia fusiformis]
MAFLALYLPTVVMVAGVVLMTFHVEALYKDSLTPELLLMKYLMTDYNANVRPVKNTSEATVVTIDIALTQIADVTWEDYFLKWNESDYGGVKTIHLKPADVWIPDITLYTDVTGQYYETKEFRLKVTSDGTVQWKIPTKFVSSCKMKVHNFPYDVQTCTLKFGSWGFGSTEIDLQNKSDSADLSAYEPSGEWELLSTDAIRHSLMYNCCTEPYIDVTYYINIKRKPLYYTFNVILPCMFIVIISPFSFLVPPGCGERIQLSTTLFLSLTVYMLFVAEQLPVQSEDVPLVGQFFTTALFALALLNVTSIISVHLFHRGSKRDKLPRMAKLFTMKVAKLVCMANKFDEVVDLCCCCNSNEKENTLELKRCDRKVENGVCLRNKEKQITSQKYKESDQGATSGGPSVTQYDLVQLVYDINSHLTKLCKYKTTSQGVDAIKREWKMVALVIDRCLFILSSIFTIAFSLCFILYKAEPY